MLNESPLAEKKRRRRKKKYFGNKTRGLVGPRMIETSRLLSPIRSSVMRICLVAGKWDDGWQGSIMML